LSDLEEVLEMRNTFRLSGLVAIMLLFVTASGSMALAQNASGSGSVSDQARPVLDRAIQFLGGADNIRALKDLDMRWQGTMNSPQGTLERRGHDIYVYPGVMREEYKVSLGEKSMSVEFFFDGANGWRIENGSLSDLSEDQKNGYRQAIFNKLPNLLGLVGRPTVTYAGKSDGNDVLMFRLGDLSARLHVDSTGQVVKRSYHTATADIDHKFSDYREVGGVKLAYKTSGTRNGQTSFDEQITEAKANTNPSLERLAQKPGGPPLSATYLATIAPLTLPAFYVSAQTPSDKLQLSADNSFSLQEGGVSYRGTFAANGGTLELNFSDGATKATLSRQGSDLSGSDGQTWSWREQSAGLAPGEDMLRNEDVIRLVTVGIDDATIITKIRSSKCQFDTSTAALVQLKKSGVKPAVLKVMMGSGK
jgi:hypothetical protein